MTPSPRLLSDQEFAALSTDEKYNYLYAMVQYLLGSRAKTAAETAATPEAADAEARRTSPAEPLGRPGA